MKKFLLSITALMAISAFTLADETVSDICGNTYPVVTIGEQVWMAENLKCNKYDTESEAYNASWLTDNEVPTSSSAVYTPYYTDATDRNKWESATYSRMSSEQIAKLGYLYNWAAVVGVENSKLQTEAFEGNRQGICPNGWHVPSNDEYQALEKFINDDQRITGKVSRAGKHLKSTSGWYVDDEAEEAVDTYGFTALPACFSRGNKVDEKVGKLAYFSTSTPYIRKDIYYNYNMSLDYCSDAFYISYGAQNTGLSVRCLKGGTTSAFESEADASPSVSKQLIDGQIVIIKGDKKYNLQGVEIK